MNKKNNAEQSVVLRQCSALLGAGLTFHESASILARESRSKKDVRLFTQLADELSAGKVVSDVLEGWGWNRVVVTLVRVGEISGSLAQACGVAARELAYRVALKKKIVGMMLYPACVFVCATFLVVGIVSFVFPKILPVLQSIDGVLPFPTRVVLWVTHIIQYHGIKIVVGASVVMMFVYVAWKKFSFVQRWTSMLVLMIPGVGYMVRIYTVAQISRTMSVLSGARIDVVDCIDHVHDVVGNRVYQRALEDVRESVMQGTSLSRSLGAFPALFPSTVTSMIAVAEQSGSLAEMTGSLSEIYEAEYTAILERLAKLIEPLLMIGLGLVVGFIAISIITPLYEITTHVQQ